MLIILPPSETKRDAPASGNPVDLGRLSFPELNELRELLLDSLAQTSSRHDGPAILRVGPSLLPEIARNTAVRELPTIAASELYIGPLHEALDFESLPPRARERARTELVITSSLWGMLRTDDRIPPYRLVAWAELPGIGRVDHAWRRILPAVLAEAAGPSGAVLDLRSAPYQSIGAPASLGNRSATLRVLPEPGAPTIAPVIAKRIRGLVARHLLELGPTPKGPGDLADALSDRWPVRLEPPETRAGPWTLSIRPTD